MIIQGQSQHRIDDQHQRQHRIDDQHQRRSSKVMSQPHDLPTMSEAEWQQQHQNQVKVAEVEEVSSSKGLHVFPPSAKTLPQPPPDWLIERELDKNPPVNDSWQIFAIHLK
nr:hypothetical protein HmN_000577100 [Hymenolepis microstoma]